VIVKGEEWLGRPSGVRGNGTLSAGGMVGQPTLVMLSVAKDLGCDVSQDTSIWLTFGDRQCGNLLEGSKTW
jgi:hypothetical protein